MLNLSKKLPLILSIILFFSVSMATASEYKTIEEKSFSFPSNDLLSKYYVTVLENQIDGSNDIFIGKYKSVNNLFASTIKEPAFFSLSKKLTELGQLPTDYFGKIMITDIKPFSNAVRIEIRCLWKGESEDYWIYYFGNEVKIRKGIWLSKKNDIQNMDKKNQNVTENTNSENLRRKAVNAQISLFETALDSYRLDNGHYPSSSDGLKSLIKNPGGEENWDGPYVKEIPKDPWGHDYIYFSFNESNTCTLISCGPDGIKDTKDDISNETMQPDSSSLGSIIPPG